MSCTGCARLIAACTGLLALPAVLVANALAGSYTINSCSPLTSPSPWSEVNTFTTGLSTGNMCGGPAAGSLRGGTQGALARMLAEGRRAEAEELLAAFAEAFPDRVAMELHRHGVAVDFAMLVLGGAAAALIVSPIIQH